MGNKLLLLLLLLFNRKIARTVAKQPQEPDCGLNPASVLVTVVLIVSYIYLIEG